MFVLIKDKKGSGLIGILVVVFIVAALVYGGVFFSKNTNNNESETNQTNINSPVDAINTLNKAKEDIGEINEKTESRKQKADVIINESDENNLSEDEFDEYTISVSNIKPGDNLVTPVVIEGDAVAFENTVIVELRNQEHETMVKEYVTTKAPDVGKSGPFKITLSFDFSSTKEGYLAVYEESAKDGSEVNLVEIPVTFNKDDWRIYRNEEFGIEFQYPINYYYSDKGRKLIENNNNGATITIYTPDWGRGIEPYELGKEELLAINPNVEFEKSIYNWDDDFAKRPDDFYKFIIISWGSGMESGSFEFSPTSENDTSLKAIDVILETFKFID